MSDVIVSVRMPKKLAQELKQLVEDGNFLDLSEQIRSIVRQKWNFYNYPQLFEIKKLRENIEEEIRKKSAKRLQQEVVKELEKIKSQLKKEGFADE